VLSSPPYAGTSDYAAIHDARFLWLGLPEKTFRRVQLGARANAVGDVYGAGWRAQQERFMAEIARILRPGGRALLVVGDGVIDGRAENAPDGIAEAGAPVGLAPVARASQARPLHDRRLADIFATHPRREHLLLLEKAAR
jgi:SAM-dependent methyltransferase